VTGRIEERQQARMLRRLQAKGTTHRGSKSHPVREIETQHIRDNRGFRSQVQAGGQQGRQVPGTSWRTTGASGLRHYSSSNDNRSGPRY
jgi:hypothetical protein